MELRNATIDKHAASYETTAEQLKSTLCVPAIQHKRGVNPKKLKEREEERERGKRKQTLQGCLAVAERGFTVQ